MTTRMQKQVLYIGTKTDFLSHLEAELQVQEIAVLIATCEEATPKFVEEKDVDLIVINISDTSKTCHAALSTLQSANMTHTVPVFALVQKNDTEIQDVLTRGATDYITPDEDTATTMQKINAALSSRSEAFGSATIDITPLQADITATGVRVYVIEDDPLLRNLLSVQLNKSSFPYEFSKDGQNTIPSMKQFKPDVIILDLMLPGKSGFDILVELKDEESLKAVPVIVFSNRDGQDDRQRAKELGAAHFYVKAMTDLSELIETIQTLSKR